MSRQKLYITFVVLVGTGTTVLYLMSFGLYPVAMVQGHLISAGKFRNEYRAALSYHDKAVQMYGGILDPNKKLSPQDIELSTMDQIIEDAIIRDGADKEVGPDLNRLAGKKTAQYENDDELAKGAADIYGLSKKGFSEYVLVPQAVREILTDRLSGKGEDFNDWLVMAKKSAHVTIFSTRFKWNGEEVAMK
jgi:hypothetical protein